MNVSARDLRLALDLVQRAQPLKRSPLLALEQLGQALREEGIADTAEAREWQLIGLLHDLVAERLAGLRGGEAPRRDAVPDFARERQLLNADFESGNIEREAWSALYYRYLSSLGWSAGEVAETARPGYSDAGRHLRRRVIRGCRALAELLNERERAALVRRDEGEAPPPREAAAAPPGARTERQPSASPAADPDAQRARAAAEALLAALRSGRAPDTLDAGLVDRLEGYPPGDAAGYRLQRLLARRAEPDLGGRLRPELALLVDQGEANLGGRWARAGRDYAELRVLLEAEPAPVLVLLGPPGAGKSWLLRRLELELCLAGLRGETELLPAHFELSGYAHGEPSPLAWLERRWRERQPHMPSLEALLAEGRLLLLLDGLNEMPQADEADYHNRVRGWKILARELATSGKGNRLLFSCRELHYSTPLSSPELRVPQVLVQALEPEAIAGYLRSQAPETSEHLGRVLGNRALVELARRPYFLRLLTEGLADPDAIQGPAALLSAFVRRALAREIARDNPLLAAGDGLLTRRERSALARGLPPANPHALPERGRLIPALSELAQTMLGRAAGDLQRLQIDFDTACAWIEAGLEPPMAPDAVERAIDLSLDLGLLEQLEQEDALRFPHQLLQAYLAARRLRDGRPPPPAPARWRAEAFDPPLVELLAELSPADPLPPLPASGWEASLAMAAAMSADAAGFVEGLAASDLVLAGRIAGQADLAGRLPEPLLDGLRQRLAERSRDPAADLRVRIAAAAALGPLGDPRWTVIASEGVTALRPPTRPVDGIEDLELGRFPATNAEWACFVDAGGYEDPRWWGDPGGEAWRSGETTAAGERWNLRSWRRRFLEDPSLLPGMLEAGRIPPQVHALWQERLALDPQAFEALLAEQIASGPRHEPSHWRDEAFNRPLQPVVGVSWYEARAYARWLSAIDGRPWRLPDEREWARAARGAAGRRFAWGEDFGRLRANTVESHLRRTSPVGVFVEGDTPEGLSDLTGNVWEWTTSPAEVEDPDAAGTPLRITRGGSWLNDAERAASDQRFPFHPGHRNELYGFRLALEIKG